MTARIKNRRDFTRYLAMSMVAMATGKADGTFEDGHDENRHSDDTTGNDTTDSDVSNQPDSEPQAGLPTLGGMQFWGDVLYLQGFRIQHNVLTGNHRLLDAANRRYFSGAREECEASLDKLRHTQKLTYDTGHAIIYLHGIGRSSRSLSAIKKAMPTEGHVHIPFEYPSTRVSIERASGYLNSVIESLRDVSRISFVVHSMGGLVVRRYLKDHRDHRIHRMVMMGTPNNGAELADMLKGNFLFRTIYGPAGQELVTEADGTIKSLPTPDFEFGIVAGGKGDDKGFNRLLPGDNDGTVTIASARLVGAADFLQVPKIHSFLMTDATVIAAVRHFLEHGCFSPDRKADPITEISVSTETPVSPEKDDSSRALK